MSRGTSAAFNRWFGRGWLAAGFVFLYLPIVALVIFSFNDSPIPNVWRGFTLKWYAALATDHEIQAGLWLSLKIAFLTACGSVMLGTLAAFALVRYKRFTGRTLFSGMVNAPLVMPKCGQGRRRTRLSSMLLSHEPTHPEHPTNHERLRLTNRSRVASVIVSRQNEAGGRLPIYACQPLTHGQPEASN